MDCRRTSHSVHEQKCHVVWITNYRRPALRGEIAARLRELVRRTFDKLDLYIPSVRVIDCHTRKSLDVETVLRAARETSAIVTAENSIILGGLGSAVAEVVVKNPRTRMKHFGVQDRFPESGPYLALPDKYGLSVPHIAHAVRDVVARKG